MSVPFKNVPYNNIVPKNEVEDKTEGEDILGTDDLRKNTKLQRERTSRIVLSNQPATGRD